MDWSTCKKAENNWFTTRNILNLSQLDRSKDAEIQMLCSSMPSEDKDGEAPIPKDTQNASDMDLCAPDSLDPSHGITQSSTVSMWTPKKEPYTF